MKVRTSMTFKTTSARTISRRSEPIGNRNFASGSSGSRGAKNELRKKFGAISPNIRHLTRLESINTSRKCRENVRNKLEFMPHNPFRISRILAKNDARLYPSQTTLLEGVTHKIGLRMRPARPGRPATKDKQEGAAYPKSFKTSTLPRVRSHYPFARCVAIDQPRSAPPLTPFRRHSGRWCCRFQLASGSVVPG